MNDNIFAVRLDANELALLGEKIDNIFAVCLDANELAKLANGEPRVDGFIFYGSPGIGKNLFCPKK